MRIGTISGTVVGLAILLALLAGGYFAFRYTVNVFGALERQTEILAAIAAVTALLCAWIVADGVKSVGTRQAHSREAMLRAKLYEELLYLCREKRALDAELAKPECALALHGGAKVVAAYAKFRGAEKATEDAALLNDLLMEMRTDIGRPQIATDGPAPLSGLLRKQG